MGGGISRPNVSGAEETPISEPEEVEIASHSSSLNSKPTRGTMSNAPTASMKDAVSKTLYKINFISSRNTSKVFSEISEDSVRNTASKRIPKTPRTVSTTSKSRNTSRTESISHSQKQMNQSRLVPQASRLSYGSVDSMGANFINYPLNNEIFNKLHDGSNIFGTNKHARNAFIKFMKSKCWVDQLMKPLKVMKNVNQSSSENNAHQLGGITFNQYKVSSRHKTEDFEETQDHFMSRINLIQQLKINDTREQLMSMDSYSERSSGDKYRADKCFDSTAMKAILIATLYPLFVRTTEFHQLCEKRLEVFRIEEMQCEDVSSSLSLNTTPSFQGAMEDDSVKKNTPEYRKVRDIYLNTLDALDAPELHDLLRTSSWISEFLTAIEEIPHSLTIAYAAAESRDFPVVYVTDSFEEITQFKRRDIIGKSCNILQCKNSEAGQLAIMSQALELAEPCKVAVCNAKKSGQEMFNFVTLHPVLDDLTDAYKFVVGVQYDIAHSEASIRELRQIDDFVLILANMLK